MNYNLTPDTQAGTHFVTQNTCPGGQRPYMAANVHLPSQPDSSCNFTTTHYVESPEES